MSETEQKKKQKVVKIPERYYTRYKDHEISEDGNVVNFKQPKTLRLVMFVVFHPYAIVVWGDNGSWVIHHTGGNPLEWLKAAAGSKDYFFGKLDSNLHPEPINVELTLEGIQESFDQIIEYDPSDEDIENYEKFIREKDKWKNHDLNNRDPFMKVQFYEWIEDLGLVPAYQEITYTHKGNSKAERIYYVLMMLLVKYELVEVEVV